MSSPMMKRMLGFCCCCADAGTTAPITMETPAKSPKHSARPPIFILDLPERSAVRISVAVKKKWGHHRSLGLEFASIKPTYIRHTHPFTGIDSLECRSDV